MLSSLLEVQPVYSILLENHKDFIENQRDFLIYGRSLIEKNFKTRENFNKCLFEYFLSKISVITLEFYNRDIIYKTRLKNLYDDNSTASSFLIGDFNIHYYIYLEFYDSFKVNSDGISLSRRAEKYFINENIAPNINFPSNDFIKCLGIFAMMSV